MDIRLWYFRLWYFKIVYFRRDNLSNFYKLTISIVEKSKPLWVFLRAFSSFGLACQGTILFQLQKISGKVGKVKLNLTFTSPWVWIQLHLKVPFFCHLC